MAKILLPPAVMGKERRIFVCALALVVALICLVAHGLPVATTGTDLTVAPTATATAAPPAAAALSVSAAIQDDEIKRLRTELAQARAALAQAGARAPSPLPPPAPLLPPPTPQTGAVAGAGAGAGTAAAAAKRPAWAYWDHCGGGDSCPPFSRYEPPSPEQERFLLFETRGAGLNNERMSLEIAYALALGWGRTLVLPPHCGNPSNPRSFFKFEEIFDLEALRGGLRVMTAAEFVAHGVCARAKWPSSPSMDQNWAGGVRSCRQSGGGWGAGQAELLVVLRHSAGLPWAPLGAVCVWHTLCISQRHVALWRPVCLGVCRSPARPLVHVSACTAGSVPRRERGRGREGGLAGRQRLPGPVVAPLAGVVGCPSQCRAPGHGRCAAPSNFPRRAWEFAPPRGASSCHALDTPPSGGPDLVVGKAIYGARGALVEAMVRAGAGAGEAAASLEAEFVTHVRAVPAPPSHWVAVPRGLHPLRPDRRHKYNLRKMCWWGVGAGWRHCDRRAAGWSG
jgi:hypothetical protein